MNIHALRHKEKRFVVGLMSGTSCDGIDAALVRIKGSGVDIHVKLLEFITLPYTPGLRTRLLAPKIDVHEICLLNFELGERMAEAVLDMQKVAEEKEYNLDFVASHGHTVAHHPPNRFNSSIGTLQIGESAVIAERTGLPVISDFRPRDMAAGGQGAPLVPYADWLMFRRPDRTVACLNIGGIANVTVVPPEFESIMAFDTGPGNMIIDGTISLLTRGSQQIDNKGKNAAKGIVIDEFLDYLLDHQFFGIVPPKSAGREQFGPEVYLRDALAARSGYSLEDIMATVTSAVAYSIVRAYNRFIKPHHDIDRLILSGGGTHNHTLIKKIKQGLPDVVIRKSEDYGIPDDAREAIAFAVLGNETICGTPANVIKATGARHPVVLGKITPN